jgi:hypothetical protein
MSWIKRNLYFLIGAASALVLLGLAGWFLFTKWQLNSQNLNRLNKDYADLSDLNGKKPHPGNDKIDNFKAATDQTAQLLAFKEKARVHFQPIAPIPDLPQAELTDQSFATNFSRVINQLQRDATNASIALPPDYYFSFQTQARKLSFVPGSLQTLANQLGEVKAICDILIQAKINTIESIRRECVSPDDRASSSTGDYLQDKSLTNTQAILTPYEITFRCFSPELGAVLAGFSCSPCSFVVKALNVEGLAPSSLELGPSPLVPSPTPSPAVAALPTQPQPTVESEAERRDRARRELERRYRRYGPGGVGPYRRPTPTTTSPASAPNPVGASSTLYPAGAIGLRGAPPGAQAKTGPTIAIDEKQLKVTMALLIVKLQAAPVAPAKPVPASKTSPGLKPVAPKKNGIS